MVTEKDIAFKKSDSIPEWGIFGLGFNPGNTSIISTFRLKKNVTNLVVLERIRKVSIHEFGHNMGLSHCEFDIQCVMNDARGSIKQVDKEKKWLCKMCYTQLNH